MELIRRILDQGGPEKADYPELHARIDHYGKLLGHASAGEQYDQLVDLLQPVLTSDTMQGFAFQKPHGYAGDYEIIDRIYTGWESERGDLARWDRFFHDQEAPIAVRNRKEYFKELLASSLDAGGELRVLNIGSGPGRDMKEFFEHCPDAPVSFECVDLDKNAINYASRLCAPYLDRIRFVHNNVFKFESERRYDIVWSAGLFDYLDDSQFVFLLQKLYGYVARGGKLVVGNFSHENPSRNYMELIGKWFLRHRSPGELTDLALEAGFDAGQVDVLSESLGVNLFLHIQKKI